VLVAAHGDGGVRVEVVDDGGTVPAKVPAGTDHATVTEGFGLVGMRERVVATGGVLEAGRVVGGGFRVVAEWPGR
jgi:signal transduction histidine kinase